MKLDTGDAIRVLLITDIVINKSNVTLLGLVSICNIFATIFKLKIPPLGSPNSGFI